MQLTKNFSKKEVECGCGCGLVPTAEAMAALQKARDIYGKPMRITSAARCVFHNKNVGGSKTSRHVDGIAFDIAYSNAREAGEILLALVAAGFKGIGIAKTFIHADLRPEPTLWDYGGFK